MYLNISKRFDLCLSRHLFNPKWSHEKNQQFFGPEANGVHGHGHNLKIYFIFSGELDPLTGMLINISDVKERIDTFLSQHYDHKFLNVDTPPFDHLIPTPEMIASVLLRKLTPLFKAENARLVACHLSESAHSEATAYADGRVDRHFWIDFSAARRTYSPQLSETENQRCFGKATAIHGHHYWLRSSLTGTIDTECGMIYPAQEVLSTLAQLHERLDHKYLNDDVLELKNQAMTTEVLAKYFYGILATKLPINRILLRENHSFAVECRGNDHLALSLKDNFHASHRLYSARLNDQDNQAIYGKCNHSHGHLYEVEVTISGSLDNKTGMLYNLATMQERVDALVKPWDYKHLDFDLEEFKDKMSTGENIVSRLWVHASDQFGNGLHRVRLWETERNRFTIRKS